MAWSQGLRIRHACFGTSLVALGLGLACARSEAGSYAVTIADTAGVTDAYFREDQANKTYGAATELRLRLQGDHHRRNIAVRFPLGALQGKTVLQAWLGLTQFASQSSTPIDARVYPVTEAWNELEATWNDRKVGVPWSRAGGSRDDQWTGRSLVSGETDGLRINWQVGPLVQAWTLGDLPNYGFLIEAAETGNREIVFRSRESTDPTVRPTLYVYYTDEAPAARAGVAEFQPSQLPIGGVGVSIVAWMDVDVSGTTATGTPTGFNTVSLSHGGKLSILSVDGFELPGGVFQPATPAWTDNGTALTVTVPRAMMSGRVGIRIRANVLERNTGTLAEMPVMIDDSATPNVWPQTLWPGDADGVAGNGDACLVRFVGSQPVRIDLVPDTLTILSTLCTNLQVIGIDSTGTRFTIVPDSIGVRPPERGTVDGAGRFCARQAGPALLIAHAGAFVDTSRFTVTPAYYPQFASLALRDRNGASLAAITPGDTLLFDAAVSDSDGFQDLASFDWTFAWSGHTADRDRPATRAAFHWARGANPAWTLVDPVGTGWSVVPALCAIDTSSRAAGPQLVRLAFVASPVAHATHDASWTVSIAASSVTPPDQRGAALGTDVAPFARFTALDAAGEFGAAAAGSRDVPLAIPADGKLSVGWLANFDAALEGSVTDLAGVEAPGETLFVDRGSRPVSWAMAPATASSGRLGLSRSTLVSSLTASTTEISKTMDLSLWCDLDSLLSPQQYRGTLSLELRELATGQRLYPLVPSLTANVAGNGLAARDAVGEVHPAEVAAGEPQVRFNAFLRPTFRLADTGIDRVLVSVPAGYGTPAVAAVKVAGLPAAFADESQAGIAAVRLTTALRSSQLIEIAFDVATPATADPAGSDFAMLFDDSATPLTAQSATPGNADLVTGGDDWHVVVRPNAIARVTIAPPAAVCLLDSTLAFAATVTDAFGNAISAAPSWSVTGSAGTIDPVSGVFTGLSSGAVGVIATAGGVRDTAHVTVRPLRAIAVRSVRGPASAYQGLAGLRFQVTVENAGVMPVTLDRVDLVVRKPGGGDVTADYLRTPPAGLPLALAPDERAVIELDADVANDAQTGLFLADAAAFAHDSLAVPLEDDRADSTQALAVARGGLRLSALQTSGTIRPGGDPATVLLLTIANDYPEARSIASIAFANATHGPGTREALDTDLGDVTLLRDDGDGVLDAGDTPLFQSVALDGVVRFGPLPLTLQAGGDAVLLLAAKAPIEARDGDVLDLAIDAAAAIETDVPVFYRNAFPLAAAGGVTVDGMTAAQIGIAPVEPRTFLAGSHRNLALEIVLPWNGYEADRLERLTVIDRGNARAGIDVGGLEAWVDDGDGVFGMSDAPLAALSFTGDRWEATGLSRAVPEGGLRIFVTVDVEELAEENRKIRLGLPGGSAEGVVMTSGNSGPLDKDVLNPFEQLVSTVDRVTFSAIPIAPSAVAPGDRGVALQHLVANNTYASTKTMDAVAFWNATAGAGSAAERDAEIEALELREDGDDDGALGDPAIDPVIGRAIFVGGRAEFTGLAWTLPGGHARHLFLTADVSRPGAADGDTLGCFLARTLDVGFTDPTTVVATVPLDSRARDVVDGLVAEQVMLLGAAPVSVGAGDGPILAFDAIVPRNGYTDDRLQSLRVVNLGDAGVRDLAELRLWRDGGNGTFDRGAGDDADLGVLGWAGGSWESGPLTEPLGAGGGRLFVSFVVSSSPAESTTVQLAIPLNGITMASGDDGPRDRAIENPHALLISREPLLATLELGRRTSTVGSDVPVRLIVRNAGTETVRGITPSMLSPAGGGAVSVSSGPAPATFDLAPAEIDTFTWSLTATRAGDVRLSCTASGVGEPSGLSRRSLIATSAIHSIYTQVSRLDLDALQSMPLTLQKGQAEFVPLSLTFSNDGGASGSDARLLGLRLALEDESGRGIVPAELLSQVVVAQGTTFYLAKTALETSGNEVDLVLATPAVVPRQSAITLSLRLGLLPTATATRFRVAIADSTWLTAEDATSGAPVGIAREEGFPLRSGFGKIVSAATRLEVAGTAGSDLRVGRGQKGVPLLGLGLTNLGTGGVTSDVRVTALHVLVTDSLGAPLADPSRVLDRLTVKSFFQTVGAHLVRTGESADLALALTPPVTVPVDVPLQIELLGDIAATASLGTFRVALGPAEQTIVFDATNGDTVEAAYTTASIVGPDVRVESAAESALVASTPLLPATLRIGDAGVPAMRLVLHHPGPAGAGRIEVDTVSVRGQDVSGGGLVPAAFLARLRLLWNGVEVAQLSSLPASVQVDLGFAPRAIEAGDSAVIDVVLDVSPAAPAGTLELAVAASGIRAVDANAQTPVAVGGVDELDLPALSGFTQLVSPARSLTAGLTSAMPASWAPDGTPVVAGVLRLANEATTSAGDIRVSRIQVSGADAARVRVPVGAAAERVEAWVGGALWASSGPLEADTLRASLAGDTLAIAAGQTAAIEIRIVPRAGGTVAAFRAGIEADGIAVVQPPSALLAIDVLPDSGQSFPMWTEAASLTPATLAGSYSNFPNPFAAGRQATSIAYYLDRAARVTLRVWTLRGEPVASLLEDSPRPAGLHQEDRWDGRNGRGTVVVNGVYVAELHARYDDGKSERVLRKVAVVR